MSALVFVLLSGAAAWTAATWRARRKARSDAARILNLEADLEIARRALREAEGDAKEVRAAFIALMEKHPDERAEIIGDALDDGAPKTPMPDTPVVWYPGTPNEVIQALVGRNTAKEPNE